MTNSARDSGRHRQEEDCYQIKATFLMYRTATYASDVFDCVTHRTRIPVGETLHFRGGVENKQSRPWITGSPSFSELERRVAEVGKVAGEVAEVNQGNQDLSGVASKSPLRRSWNTRIYLTGKCS